MHGLEHWNTSVLKYKEVFVEIVIKSIFQVPSLSLLEDAPRNRVIVEFELSFLFGEKPREFTDFESPWWGSSITINDNDDNAWTKKMWKNIRELKSDSDEIVQLDKQAKNDWILHVLPKEIAS